MLSASVTIFFENTNDLDLEMSTETDSRHVIISDLDFLIFVVHFSLGLHWF